MYENSKLVVKRMGVNTYAIRDSVTSAVLYWKSHRADLVEIALFDTRQDANAFLRLRKYWRDCTLATSERGALQQLGL